MEVCDFVSLNIYVTIVWSSSNHEERDYDSINLYSTMQLVLKDLDKQLYWILLFATVWPTDRNSIEI